VRLLFLGDVVGRSGRTAVTERLPRLIEDLRADFVVVNGENAAGGFGITESIAQDLFTAGADVLTLGNHAFDQKDALNFLDREPRVLRPLNYPRATPGRGAYLYTARSGARVLVINAMGRVFMDALNDPFELVGAEIEACPLREGCDAIVVDFHAEATSEKQSFGHFLDSRVSLVVGTHTHVPTADHRVLPGGTGFMTDIGMCGDYDSVIGMEKSEPVSRFVRKISTGRFEPAGGTGTLSGVLAEIDDTTGHARRIAPVRLGPGLDEILPPF